MSVNSGWPPILIIPSGSGPSDRKMFGSVSAAIEVRRSARLDLGATGFRWSLLAGETSSTRSTLRQRACRRVDLGVVADLNPQTGNPQATIAGVAAPWRIFRVEAIP